RHWLLKHLTTANIPYTYIGKELPNDDILQNNCDKTVINELLNASDLYIVASRKEGGPQAILEAASSNTKIISSRVGISEDILNEEQNFENIIQAAKLIIEDIETDNLANYLTKSLENTQ